MPKFTIECTYDLPVYRHRTYEAETVAAAMALAADDDEWSGAKEDYETSGPTRITGIWEGEDAAYEGTPVEFPAPVTEIRVFVVTTCIPERGEGPCLPDVFGTEAEAIAHLEYMLRAEWEQYGGYDEETGERLPYPGNWQDAQEQILAGFTDGSWGQWQLTSHIVTIPQER